MANAINESELSEWNAALATLQRIHEIKKYLDVCKKIDSPSMTYKHMKMFYMELRPLFNEDERAAQNRRWKVAKCYDMFGLFNGMLKHRRVNSFKVIDFLETWEMELRDIEQRKQMNLPQRGGIDETPEMWGDD